MWGECVGCQRVCANHPACESESARHRREGTHRQHPPSSWEGFVPYLMPEERNSAGAPGKAAGPLGAERLSDLEIKWKHDKSGLFLPKPTFITL